ncbi:carboxypeptidase-like regulatory domain-containing protein [Spirosoma sp. SC4-14]|uniref:carboxypeptidase-like regulatory domain-containing protein n=1 Tax=Spirosoma sp. SC4-14 TaxID=3128900 RepID=UPI0030D42129
MKTIVLLLLMSLLLTAAGCKTQNGYAPESDAGFAMGKVLDMRGNPIPNAMIMAISTLDTNKRIAGKTDANGNYRIKIPAGAWKMSAEIERVYHGRQFTLMLHPDNPKVFTGQDGVVCNFEWRLYGPRTGHTDRFYGGEVKINKSRESRISDIENIVFTFTPVSPRIDGSTAEPESIVCGPRGTADYARFPDIPIGQYKISARYRPTGQRIFLRNPAGGTYSADGSITTAFNGNNKSSSCANCLTLEYKD